MHFLWITGAKYCALCGSAPPRVLRLLPCFCMSLFAAPTGCLQRAPVFRYKDETKRLFAVRFNPHHNRRMQLASAKGHLVHVWNLEEKVPTATSTRGVRSRSNSASCSHALFYTTTCTRGRSELCFFVARLSISKHCMAMRERTHLPRSSRVRLKW